MAALALGRMQRVVVPPLPKEVAELLLVVEPQRRRRDIHRPVCEVMAPRSVFVIHRGEIGKDGVERDLSLDPIPRVQPFSRRTHMLSNSGAFIRMKHQTR